MCNCCVDNIHIYHPLVAVSIVPVRVIYLISPSRADITLLTLRQLNLKRFFSGSTTYITLDPCVPCSAYGLGGGGTAGVLGDICDTTLEEAW